MVPHQRPQHQQLQSRIPKDQAFHLSLSHTHTHTDSSYIKKQSSLCFHRLCSAISSLFYSNTHQHPLHSSVTNVKPFAWTIQTSPKIVQAETSNWGTLETNPQH